MNEDDNPREGLEAMMRAIVRDVSRSIERATQIDVDEIAESVGVDPDQARKWFDAAGGWLRAQVESLGDDAAFGERQGPAPDVGADRSAPTRGTADEQDPLRRAAAHPLDLPTEEQGIALAALASGRWTVEPGSNKLAAHGEGSGPSDALGLVRELRAHDWIASDGKLTLVGAHALSEWLKAARPR